MNKRKEVDMSKKALFEYAVSLGVIDDNFSGTQEDILARLRFAEGSGNIEPVDIDGVFNSADIEAMQYWYDSTKGNTLPLPHGKSPQDHCGKGKRG